MLNNKFYNLKIQINKFLKLNFKYVLNINLNKYNVVYYAYLIILV